MDSGGFFRGTSAEQDNRFSDKEKKLLKGKKFPPHFSQKVDITKVNLPIFRKWIEKEIESILTYDDEVLVDYINGLLEAESPDPKIIQINITGFLADDADKFMDKLWGLLLEAQSTPTGVPEEFLKDLKVMSAQVAAEENRIKEGLERAKQKMGNMSRVETFDHQQQQQSPATAYGLAKRKEAEDAATNGNGGNGNGSDLQRKYRRFDVSEKSNLAESQGGNTESTQQVGATDAQDDLKTKESAAVAPADDKRRDRDGRYQGGFDRDRDRGSRDRDRRDYERYRDDYDRRDRDRYERDRRSGDGGRYYDRDRRDRDRYHDDRDRDRSRSRSRDRDRGGRDRSRSRERYSRDYERDRDRGRDRSRSRSRDRYRDRSRDRYRDRR